MPDSITSPLGLERVALIDLNAIRSNVARFIEIAEPSQVLIAVKADAYGHGLVPVAQAAVQAGANWLGAAHVREGVVLREAGLTVPVLAWLHTPQTPFREAVAHGIDLGASGWELDYIAQAAQELQTPARVHLKIDTGLGRNGATAANWPSLLERAARLQEEGLIRVAGIFSHLAVSDEPHRPETDQQLAVFRAALGAAEAAGLTPEVRHLANTAATLSRPDTHFDLVRVGIGAYGLSPFAHHTSQELGLKPAMTLQTKLANVKAVPDKQGVSYGLRYHTPAATTLALVPLGYADGIPRSATNAAGALVRVRSELYPVVGTIAMDQMVLDLGPTIGDPDSWVGETATVFGANPEGPSADDWAEAAGTINYEIVTRIGERVPRVYLGRTGEPEFSLALSAPSATCTQGVAQQLAAALRAGDLLILEGELGAGKTTFTQGLAAGLNVADDVISPTFVLERIHENLADGPDLVHVDAYRLTDAEQLDALDLESTMAGSVTVIEWGRSRSEHLSDSYLHIQLHAQDGTCAQSGAQTFPQDYDDEPALSIQRDFSEEDERTRRIVINAYGPRWQNRESEIAQLLAGALATEALAGEEAR